LIRRRTPASGGGTGQGQGQERPAAPPDVEVRQTLLLPLLFETLDDEQPLTVLDVGSGTAETVAFFSGYRCRLYFAALFDAPELRPEQLAAAEPDDDPQAPFDRAFAALLDFPEGTRFDIVLLWDFLNYLPVPALRAFSQALRPYLHRGTRAHGFGAFKANAPGMTRTAPELALRYGVLDARNLAVRPRSDGVLTGYPHSRTVLADSLGCFEIERGTLLREGGMELLLQAR
jgi:SAM-dependent methyltransferase